MNDSSAGDALLGVMGGAESHGLRNRQVQASRPAPDLVRKGPVPRLVPADCCPAKDGMEGGRKKCRDLIGREWLCTRRERDQVIDPIPQSASVRGGVVPQVHTQAVTKRGEMQEGRQVEDAVVPRACACELARLAP